ncbi:hypothetical protein E8E13_003798 [Curvularia kusanoi]|uniref:Heterokaryon incompatibility domain-containing protein n=1 Tax=Curvularia kusanoi TaxID=90978 RepID=A0A9P4W766_CURKU|nr:hypothetical protein E8E13_003798 [Curvularia kusanoi]
MVSYTYEPLSKPDSEIRVAILQPGTGGDDLHIRFETRNLEGLFSRLSKTAHPPYEALSYVWGDVTKGTRVRVHAGGVEKGNITIGQNLDIALRHLRRADEERAIYIDALCINQQDTTKDGEKSKQVAMMGWIYFLAVRTIVWLGPEADDSTAALDLIRHWTSQVALNEANLLQPINGTADASWADSTISLPYVAGELNSIHKLLNRPYFERTWTRQECTLARDAVVQCGTQQIPWVIFVRGVAYLHLKRHYSEALDVGQVYDFARAVTKAFDLTNLPQLNCEYANLRLVMGQTKCFDLRDKIHGQRYLLNDYDQKLAVEPDYTVSVEDLYTEVARRVIIEDHRLNLLQACEVSSRDLPSLPSWVPDWSVTMKVARSHPAANWSACAWITSRATLTAGRVLRVSGIEAARVEEVIEWTLDAYACQYEDVLEVLKMIGRSAKVQEDMRTQGASCIERYCKALVGDLFAESFHPLHPQRPSLTKCTRFLQILWDRDLQSEAVFELFEADMVRTKLLLLDLCHLNFVGRCFFQASSGYFGLAPTGTQTDDVVSVILGCKHPLILRRATVPGPETEEAWFVVGVCLAEGLQYGEIIYRGRLPDHYRPVSQLHGQPETVLDRTWNALWDSRRGELKTNPAELLGELGIRVERYHQVSHGYHVLDVAVETLTEFGVAIQEFALV